MKISFIAIVFIYYLSWMLNDKKRNNIMYNGVNIPRQFKIILNPFKDNNEFDLSSIIFEIYAHISLLYFVSSVLSGKMLVFDSEAWFAVTFSLFCIIGSLNLIFDTKKRKNIINKVINILIIIILMVLAIVSLFLVFSMIGVEK
jgi:hypothetical protein